LGVSEKKDMSEACARFISWTQFGPLGLFGPLNAKQNLSFMVILGMGHCWAYHITKDLSTWAGKIIVKHPENIRAASASRPNGQVAQVGPIHFRPAQTSMS